VRNLFVYLIQESGAELVPSHRADDLGADRRSVETWVGLLEETFLVQRLERRQLKASKRLRARSKLYAADHGLVTAFAASPDPVNDPDVRSKVFEAIVYRHLQELARGLSAPLTYLRTDEDLEVDFVVDIAAGPIAIEVTHSRRVKAEKIARLKQAGEVIGAARLVMIHGGALEQTPGSEDAGSVIQLPISRFLAEPSLILPAEEIKA